MTTFNPLDHPVCLRLPARLAASTWAEHVPFAMCLVDLVRPRTVVELGTFYGVSYCAFCQAVKELQIAARGAAVDTWRGDAQSGSFGDEVLEDLRRHHDPSYGSFSQLIQKDFADAVSLFDDGSIDLLHIDGCHTYDAVRRDYELWRPKISGRGIVLFHDTAVRENDFGVWRLWEDLKRQHPERAFEFEHGCGLGLIAVGGDYPRALDSLFRASTEETQRIREFFRHAGMLIGAICSSELRIRTLANTVEGFRNSRAIRLATRLSSTRAGALARWILTPQAKPRPAAGS